MCLATITSKRGRPLTHPRIGYKVFRRKPDGAVCPLLYDMGKSIKLRRWLQAKRVPINSGDEDEYVSGFHIYTDPELIDRDWAGLIVIHRVEYKGRLTYGYELNCPVVVAEKMRDLGPCDEKGELL